MMHIDEELLRKLRDGIRSSSLPGIDDPAPDDCWIWTRTMNTAGYGQVWNSDGTHQLTVHRVAYEAYVGPIPDGLEVDHLCNVRLCVNPAHLEIVTHAENLRRGAERRRRLRENPGPAVARTPVQLSPKRQRTIANGRRLQRNYMRRQRAAQKRALTPPT